jgi:hypothetical protein
MVLLLCYWLLSFAHGHVVLEMMMRTLCSEKFAVVLFQFHVMRDITVNIPKEHAEQTIKAAYVWLSRKFVQWITDQCAGVMTRLTAMLAQQQVQECQ